MRIAVVGGGAAGFFGAIAAASVNPAAEVEILEAAQAPLQKVRISGGGRCNVTHHCFEPRELVAGYPRGAKALLGPLTRFGPRETAEWFESRGVRLKAEADGRMFPVTDRSSSVVDCLLSAATDAGVRLRLGVNVRQISHSGEHGTFTIDTAAQQSEIYDRVLFAAGGNPAGYRLVASLGHRVTPPVPSLFTFNVKDARLDGLAGVSFDRVEVGLDGAAAGRLRQAGPLLITHWGLSGPAVLKLSAWGARALAEARYQAQLLVNFAPGQSREQAFLQLQQLKSAHGQKRVRTERLFSLPARYWSALVRYVGIHDDTPWAQVGKATLEALAAEVVAARFTTSGKGVFKDEFVTCGGVDLNEVDFRTMQSKLVPGLYLAGEVLDIDGITGGYNFQSAWTTGWIAGTHLA